MTSKPTRAGGATGCLLFLLPLWTLQATAQPVTAKGTTFNAAACSRAGTGVFAGKKWSACGATTLSDGTVRMVVDGDVEGSAAAMKTRTDTQGKPCEVAIASGVVTVSGPGFKASAALNSEPEDTIVRTNDGRTFINATTVKDKVEIAREFDPKEGLRGAQAKSPGRMLTCGRDA
jgi:hypothetical protein